MTDRKKKAVIHEDVPGTQVGLALISHGYLEPLIELLQSDREIPRFVRVVLRDMLKADPARKFHLVCKPTAKQRRGAPSKSIDKVSRDFHMGIRVHDQMENGEKYVFAISVAAEEFGVSGPTAEKAYKLIKDSRKESGFL